MKIAKAGITLLNISIFLKYVSVSGIRYFYNSNTGDDVQVLEFDIKPEPENLHPTPVYSTGQALVPVNTSMASSSELTISPTRSKVKVPEKIDTRFCANPTCAEQKCTEVSHMVAEEHMRTWSRQTRLLDYGKLRFIKRRYGEWLEQNNIQGAFDFDTFFSKAENSELDHFLTFYITTDCLNVKDPKTGVESKRKSNAFAVLVCQLKRILRNMYKRTIGWDLNI